jgi:hypothetical protein
LAKTQPILLVAFLSSDQALGFKEQLRSSFCQKMAFVTADFVR